MIGSSAHASCALVDSAMAAPKTDNVISNDLLRSNSMSALQALIAGRSDRLASRPAGNITRLLLQARLLISQSPRLQNLKTAPNSDGLKGLMRVDPRVVGNDAGRLPRLCRRRSPVRVSTRRRLTNVTG